MWEELGISGGTAIIILIALYFVIMLAVKHGIESAYRSITGKQTFEDKEEDKMIEQWDQEEKQKKQKSRKREKKE